MTVHAVIYDPQGSTGGFDWFYSPKEAEDRADEVGRDLVLGVIPITVEDHGIRDKRASDAITREIDERLLEIEERLGYDPAAYA